MKNKTLATIYVLFAASFWGTMGLFVRYFDRLGLGSMDVVALRVLVAAMVLPAVIGFLRPDAFRVKWKDLWCFFGTGVISIAMFNYCYFRTISATSMGVAAVLLYSAPVIVVLLSAVLFKERITWMKAAACAVAFLGCVLVSDLQGGSIPPVALLTGILSAVGYALYSIFSRCAMDRGYHSFTILVYTFWFSLLGVLPFSDLPGTVSKVQAAGPLGWGLVLLMGTVTAILPYAFYTLGLSGLEAGKASVMASLEPVVATLLGAVVFQEIPSFTSFIGILLVLAGVLLLNLKVKYGKKHTSITE
ncbi:MAG: EamA family transporter [Clostridia bacterium]|nr:EamA family transporter [Clostridia bacterium]